MRIAFAFPGGSWHISGNGTDTPGCGKTASSACKSFDWFLAVVQERSADTTRNLSIVTDTDLKLHHKLLVKLLCLYQNANIWYKPDENVL